MFADIIILVAVLGYCTYIVYRLIRGQVTGEGNPFSCTGDCASCTGACQTPRAQEKMYREIKRSMRKQRKRMNSLN